MDGDARPDGPGLGFLADIGGYRHQPTMFAGNALGLADGLLTVARKLQNF
jgi:hypothetical protein